MTDPLAALEKRIGYHFNDAELLRRAMTHGSYGDGKGKVRSNERLEFLGDRVLGLLTAETLVEQYSGADEGGLAPRLNTLVRKETCADVARAVGLGEALLMARSEDKAGGRDKTSILGDATEALMAALYLDGGMKAARDFFHAQWGPRIEALRKKPKDPKSSLQEWAARAGHGAPRYSLTERGGPDHRPVFTVEVTVGGLAPAVGEGGSKQSAERAAAKLILEREGVDGV